MGKRDEVLAYAAQHGPAAAARHFKIPKGTVTGWQARARKQQPSPAERYVQAAAELAERAAAGVCLRCGGAGYLTVNPRGARGAVRGYRFARRVVCPDCGAPRNRLVVTGTNLELAGRAAAADLQAVREQEDHGNYGHPEAWR